MSALDPRTADRLAKLIALLGSDHDGEVVAAARAATRLMREHDLDWHDLIEAALRPAPATGASIGRTAAPSGDEREVVARCWRQRDRMNGWETQFVASLMRWCGRFLPKQAAKLRSISHRLRAERRAA
jgi:hypothetical protein